MKIEPSPEFPLLNPFGLSAKDLTEIIDSYRSRKLAEELDVIQELGGIDEILNKLQSNKKNGLTSMNNHSHRKEIFGKNKLPKEKVATYCEICWEALKDLTLRILIISGVVSIFLGAFLGEHPEYEWIEGFAIIVAVAVVVNVTAINDLQKQKKFSALKDANKKTKFVRIVRDGVWSSVHPKKLMVGDVVKLENGLTIPADGLLIEGFQIEVVEASMTGENDNIKKLSVYDSKKHRDEFYKLNLSDLNLHDDHHHEVPSAVMLSGTNLSEGYGLMLVIAVGKLSAEGRITDLVEQEADSTPLMKKLDKLASAIGKGGLFAALITVLSLFIRITVEKSIKDDWSKKAAKEFVDALIIGITVLVVAIPEGLPLAVTISLAYSVKKMQKDNNLVRKLHACETMGGADMICSDKTGTLTQNKMTVSEFWAGGIAYDFEKNRPSHKTFQAEFLHVLKESVFTNSSAFIDANKGEVGSKTEIAMLMMMLALGHSDYVETRVNYLENFHKFFPFSSKRKRSSVLITLEGDKKRLHVKGAAEILVKFCCFYLDGEAVVRGLSLEDLEIINAKILKMTEKALRVIALAYVDIQNDTDFEVLDVNGFPLVETKNLVLIGLAGIRDPLRDEVPQAVLKCQKAGITVRMVTGDNMATARAIAKECHIITSEDQLVMEGKDFAEKTGGTICSICRVKVCSCPRSKSESKKSGKSLRKDVISHPDQFRDLIKNLAVLARSSPDDKYTLVTGLKELGHVVAVTGDGTNDAPALKKADIGFAMGIAGTEMAQEAAGIILLDDNFNSIVRAVVWGRNIYDNIRCFLQFQLTVNVVAVALAMIGAVVIQQSPLTSVQLLWVNLIMDSFASLALATDPPTDDHLNRTPHRRNDFIIERIMWKHIFGQSIMQLVLLFFMTFAGERFLPQVNSQGKIDGTVQSGRKYRADGGEEYGSNEPSRHFTYIFNVFVLLQLMNEFNSRKLRDEFNVFEGISRNWLFITIWVGTILVQILIVSVGYIAFGCQKGGLTVHEWLICLAFSSLSLFWRIFLLLLPSRFFPQSGSKENSGSLGSGILSVRASGITKRQSLHMDLSRSNLGY
jgi:Ca2+ transporting ATPase